MSASKRQEEYIRDLLIAKGRISSGDTNFICPALHHTEHAGALRAWIRAQLQGSRALEEWMYRHHSVYFHQTNCFVWQALRLKWVDAMIEELRK